MNTADRSLVQLDAALRRRFDFEEMMPAYTLNELSDNLYGINLKRMLEVMNERITVLLDREHQIGHSVLLNLSGVEELEKVFNKKIIPLLQEYFYDDYENINKVLNNNGFVKSYAINIFGDNNYDSKIYKIETSQKVDDYKAIYEVKAVTGGTAAITSGADEDKEGTEDKEAAEEAAE
jgi:5-methylcytosine-specific restriction protein B